MNSAYRVDAETYHTVAECEVHILTVTCELRLRVDAETYHTVANCEVHILTVA